MCVPFCVVWISFVFCSVCSQLCFPVCESVRANERDKERLILSVDLSQATLSLCLCLFPFFPRHTSQFQTRRRIWTLSTPPLSVNSHSLTFTSRHSSCGPNKFSPWTCVACGLLKNGRPQWHLTKKTPDPFINMYCKSLRHVVLMFGGFGISDGERASAHKLFIPTHVRISAQLTHKLWLPLGARSRNISD